MHTFVCEKKAFPRSRGVVFGQVCSTRGSLRMQTISTTTWFFFRSIKTSTRTH